MFFPSQGPNSPPSNCSIPFIIQILPYVLSISLVTFQLSSGLLDALLLWGGYRRWQQKKSHKCAQNAQKIKQVPPGGKKKNSSQDTRTMPKSAPKLHTEMPGTSIVRVTGVSVSCILLRCFPYGYEWKRWMAT